MTDHPNTFRAEDTFDGKIDWNDSASVHRKDDGQGLLDGMKGLHRGTFAEMVALVSRMSEEERDGFVVQKAGDRAYSIEQILKLASRSDFPGA